ncbi:unnamed protein product [Sphagnum tenellum]
MGDIKPTKRLSEFLFAWHEPDDENCHGHIMFKVGKQGKPQRAITRICRDLNLDEKQTEILKKTIKECSMNKKHYSTCEDMDCNRFLILVASGLKNLGKRGVNPMKNMRS